MKFLLVLAMAAPMKSSYSMRMVTGSQENMHRSGEETFDISAGPAACRRRRHPQLPACEYESRGAHIGYVSWAARACAVGVGDL